MTVAYAHVQRTETLEDAREALHSRDASLNAGRREQALSTYRLYLRWAMLYPRASLREFVTWLGYGEYTGRHYAYIYGGFAQDRGFTDAALRLGDLQQIGQALMLDGSTPEDVRARLAAGQPARLSTKTTAPMSVPAPEREAMQGSIDRVSESDGLPAPEAHAKIFRAWEAAGPTFQAAMLHAEETGQNPLDALVQAVGERSDYRNALKQQGCVFCGVKTGIELHHTKAEPGDRFRTHDRLVPVCQRHHGARAGDSADSIHAYTYEEMAGNADFWRAAFIAVSDAAEATRPTKETP